MIGKLFIHNKTDCVAQALTDLKAGEEVLVITADGVEFSNIIPEVHIPKNYHVSIKNLRHKEYVIKAGWEIGQINAVVYDPDFNKPASKKIESIKLCKPWDLPPGYPIHLGNFIPSINLWQAWGRNIIHPGNISIELGAKTGYAPYQIAKIKRPIQAQSEIR